MTSRAFTLGSQQVNIVTLIDLVNKGVSGWDFEEYTPKKKNGIKNLSGHLT